MARLRIGDVVIDTERLVDLSPGGQLEARMLLQEAERLREVNPLHFYRPASAKHEVFHDSDAGVKAIFGGNRAGKTTTAIVDDLIQMTPWELLPEHLHPFKRWSCPFYCRVMTPDMERTMKPVIHHKLKEWTPQALLKGGQFNGSYSKAAGALYLECGCRFDFLSYEMDLDKFGGAALHRCHFDEEPPEDIRNECLMRLVDYNGQEVYAMTPLKGLTWTRRRIWKNRADPDVCVVEVSMRDNPNLNQAGVESKLALLSDEQREMREKGRFVNEAGMVYPEVREWLTSPPEARTVQAHPVLVGIDPGIRKAGITWTSWDPEGLFLTFAALELRDQTVEGYAKAIKSMNALWGIRDEQGVHYVIDPAARARSLTNAESVESELTRLGIYTEHGQNDVDTGILMLKRLGEGGLWKIASNLEDFIESLEEYPLEEWADGTMHPAKTGNEHRADATRYAISARGWPDVDEGDGQKVYPADVAQPPRRQPAPVGVAGDMV